MRLSRFFLCALVLVVFGVAHTFGQIVVDRKPVPGKDSLAYYIYPVAYSVPGVGTGYGLGGTILYKDFYATLLRIGGGWDFTSLILNDIPLFTPSATLSFTYSEIQNGAVSFFGRGPDSSSEPIIKAGVKNASIVAAELNYYASNRQLNIYAGLGALIFRDVSVSGLTIDSKQDYIELQEFFYRVFDVYKPLIARFGIEWDNTDYEPDPNEGFRLRYERYFSAVADFLEFAINDLSFSQYIKTGSGNVIAWNVFLSQAESSQKNIAKSPEFLYNDESAVNTCLEAVYNKSSSKNDDGAGYYEEYRQVAQYLTPEEFCYIPNLALDRFLRVGFREGVGATTLGGASRLRSYPVGRFWDTYSLYTGVEYRQYLSKRTSLPFDYLIQRGVYNTWQAVYFLELGKVAPEFSEIIGLEKIKYSAGVGLRLLLGSAVLRVDGAYGEEGAEFVAFLGHAF